MVFVTRCPYCGAVWLLPDRETAERGPVKCSACRHSFDATSDMLQVPEQLFEKMPRPRIRPPESFLKEKPLAASPAAAPSAPQAAAPEEPAQATAAQVKAPARAAAADFPAAPQAHLETSASSAPSPQSEAGAPAPAESAAEEALSKIGAVPEPPMAGVADTGRKETAAGETNAKAQSDDILHVVPASVAAAVVAAREASYEPHLAKKPQASQAPVQPAAAPEPVSEAHPQTSLAATGASAPESPQVLQQTAVRAAAAPHATGVQGPHLQGVPLAHRQSAAAAGLGAGLKIPAAGDLSPLGAIPPGAKAEPRLSTLPSSGLSKDEPHLDIAAIGKTARPDAPKPVGAIIPAQTARAAKDVQIFVPAAASSSTPREEARSKAAGVASVVTALILLLALAAVLSVVFNQRIIGAFPQTQAFFTKVCGNVPCPGFYLADPAAFDVTRTNLRAVDESGNYLLEITVVNTSNFAQAVPSLEIVLVDDGDAPLMRRTLLPRDYLSDPAGTESIAPGRSMSVRFSLQTNVTPARCVVTPSYPEK